ncbi:MAG: peroxiredoxin [Austwickia sp.]|jgi:peroxiredoxin|nr:MAG: peroxiredoxin [Austwickia sp.]
MNAAIPAVGDAAPDFALVDQLGTRRRLSELVTDRPVLVVFYPFAFSGICTGELRELRDERERFDNAHVQCVAVSCDPMFALRAWDDAEAFFFPLLSDFWPHGAVAKSYGVWEETGGFARRGTFLVGEDMTIQWALVNGPGERRDFTGVDAAVAALAG